MPSPRTAAEQSRSSCFASAWPAARASRLVRVRAPLPFLMFDDDEDSAHSTLTSDCSFSTSCAAISAGVPVSIWVCFCFSGR